MRADEASNFNSADCFEISELSASFMVLLNLNKEISRSLYFEPKNTVFSGGRQLAVFSSSDVTIRSWQFHRKSDKSLIDSSRMFNPVLRRWINYYGSYFKSALYPICDQLNCALKQWAIRKHKTLRGRMRRGARWLGRIAGREPWSFVHGSLGGDLWLVDKSRMNREVHVRFREDVG